MDGAGRALDAMVRMRTLPCPPPQGPCSGAFRERTVRPADKDLRGRTKQVCVCVGGVSSSQTVGGSLLSVTGHGWEPVKVDLHPELPSTVKRGGQAAFAQSGDFFS